MKRATKIIVVGLIALMSVSAFAQGGGGRQGGGQRGFGGGGMTGLLSRTDVKKELKITSDQQAKLDALREAQRAAGGQGGFGGGGAQGSPPTAEEREAMMKKMQEARAKSEKDTLAILDEGQARRLKELWIQRTGNNVLTNEGIQKDLGLSDDQKSKIKDLVAKQREANTQIMERVRNQEIEREESRSVQDKNNKILSEELGKVLTTEQAAKLKTMGGAPFTFDADNGGN